MGAGQLPVLEHTVQQTNVWLKTLVTEHHLPDKHHAYSALRAVLHVLRDRLPPEQAVHLGAQMPLLVRGIFYEGWRIAGKPTDERHVDEFVARVGAELPPMFPRNPLDVTKAVFDLLWRELDPGETTKIVHALPIPLRALWPG